MIEGAQRTGRETPKPALSLRGSCRYEELLRVGLVPLFVLLCWRFDWTTWRALVTDALIPLLQWGGASVVRLSGDMFACNGGAYRVGISCTVLDVFFGSIPLLWRWRRPVSDNIVSLAAYFLCLSALNLARLEIGFLLYSHGVSWRLAHEDLAGVFYFAVFLWLARQRGWASEIARRSSR